MKKNCANCNSPQGPFNRDNSQRLCKNVQECLKRRARIDKDKYGPDEWGG